MSDISESEHTKDVVEPVEEQEGSEGENEEGMDDLFGDDDEEEEQEEIASSSKKRKRMNIDATSDNEEGEDDDEEVPFNEDEEQGEEEEEELNVTSITLPRHPRSHKPSSGLSFPLPRFLSVDPEPFAPNEFEEQIKDLSNNNNHNNSESLKNSLQFKKMELTNTIRWRYAKSSKGSLHKQSNTQIIEWEDGSKSLKIGKEYFDIKMKANDDDILAFQNNETFMGFLTLDQSIQIVPPSTKSQAHKLLAMTIKSSMKNKKAKKINTIVTDEDPEAKAREVERTQREIEKARRRQLQKAEMEEAEMERKRDTSSYSYGYNDMDIDAGGDNEDEDEDEDYGGEEGFVVGDDEEVESEMDDDELDKAAERLKQVKRDGASKYQESNDNKDGGEDDNEEEDDDEGTVIRKKRRVILDEEDEDEDE